ncbi:flagellar biosynthetic protein FliO [Comamonas sp. 17RB]|uniref:FliO/MopB family protein n=1 Tax=Comamonas sp. 17RB TaxID=3047025 RepID=UPI0024B7740B|nr:flagellar biosynthetic protein FliO [Comamonas sp. 17RB]MDI9856261.1 flagellar biosynthetic protein FliO [Comamonas sp. 17RB]
MDNSATASVSSFQTIAVLVLFIAVMAVLPWLLRRWQRRQMVARGGQGVQTQVLSTVALSPGQRIVVVEVGQGGHSTRLVLGVTAQNIHCLHVLGDAVPAGAADAAAASPASFAGAMEQLQQASSQPAASTHP